MKEKALINKCIKGNPRAQKKLFEKYYHKMYYVVKRYTADSNLVEDALTEAFCRVFDKLSGFVFQAENSLEKWIKTIAIRETLRLLKKNKRLIYTENLNSYEQNLSEDLEINYDIDYINDLIEKMPDGYRLVFNLFIVEGYAHKEIAEMLNISISTSKSQLYKARVYLIKQLKHSQEYETA